MPLAEKYNYICRRSKDINDCIHGRIQLSEFAIRVIDTTMFQRLRDLTQLGTCKYVYYDAVHPRFNHSIGTYYLTGKQMSIIMSDTDTDMISLNKYMSNIPELKSYYGKNYDNEIYPIDEYISELIKIAGLCHDLGHGPFSHVFDDEFLPLMGKKSTHEERSGLILELIIKRDEVLSELVSDDEINFIKSLINPKEKHEGWIYQIISNNTTGLDVDKFDYLCRDIYMLNFPAKIHPYRLMEQTKIINNIFAYPEQSVYDIYNLFHTRHSLHIQVYCHKVSISAQYLIIDLLKLLDDILYISDSVYDMDKFCELTEGYILNSVKIIDRFKDSITEKQLENIILAKQILNDLQTRNLYSVIDRFVSNKRINFDELLGSFPDKDNIVIFQHKVGFVSGNKNNPLDSIYTYNTKDLKKSKYDAVPIKLSTMKKQKEDITTLISSSYQEYLIIVFYKDRKLSDRIKELKDIFINFVNKYYSKISP